MKSIVVFIVIFILTAGACRPQMADNIVLINVDNYDKLKIAKEVEVLNKLNAAVISLDVALTEYSGDSADARLLVALQNCRELVIPSAIYNEGEDYEGKSMISVALTCSIEFFPPQARTGFVSATVDESDLQIPKQFIVWQKGYEGDTYHHFSVVTAMVYDSLATANFIHGNNRVVDVDYRGGRRKFRVFSSADVLNGKLLKNDIEGKIVMMGFLGPGPQDKFFSPLNLSPRDPDMYGVEYLANIVAQVLEGDK